MLVIQSKKTDYDAKISDTKTEFFTVTNFNNFASQILDTKIKTKELLEKSAITGFLNNADFDMKVVTLPKKSE